MHLRHYLALLHRAQGNLAEAFRQVGAAHRDEVDVFYTCRLLAEQCDRHTELIGPFETRYRQDATDEPDQLYSDRFGGTRTGGIGLLRDLQDLYVMAAECDICWTLIGQAAQGARDRDVVDVVRRREGETATQMAWLRTRMKQAAPQALVVAE